MNRMFKNTLPPKDSDIRQSIYAGDIYILPPTDIRLRLCAVIHRMLVQVLSDDVQTVHTRQDDRKTLENLSTVKGELETNTDYRLATKSILNELGMTVKDYALDVPRLRANIPMGHKNEEAEIAYATHRDTWYSNPKSQINFWMPIFDTTDKQSFAFYPDYFDKPVENNSAEFDYDSWIAHGHPTTHETLSNPISFAAPAGSLVMFSAAHLHQGLAHDENTIRYSIDFRTVHRGDFEKDIGAPDPDNDSAPHAFQDYLNKDA